MASPKPMAVTKARMAGKRRRRAPKQPEGYRWGPGPLDTTPGFRDAQSPPIEYGRANRFPPGGPSKAKPGNTTGQGMVEGPGRRIGPSNVSRGGRVGTNPVPRRTMPDEMIRPRPVTSKPPTMDTPAGKFGAQIGGSISARPRQASGRGGAVRRPPRPPARRY